MRNILQYGVRMTVSLGDRNFSNFVIIHGITVTYAVHRGSKRHMQCMTVCVHMHICMSKHLPVFCLSAGTCSDPGREERKHWSPTLQTRRLSLLK
jgi:hypothetical protein